MSSEYPTSIHPLSVAQLRAFTALLGHLWAEEGWTGFQARNERLKLGPIKSSSSSDLSLRWRTAVGDMRRSRNNKRPEKKANERLEEHFGRLIYDAYSDLRTLEKQDTWVQDAFEQVFAIRVSPQSVEDEILDTVSARYEGLTSDAVRGLSSWARVYEGFRYAHHESDFGKIDIEAETSGVRIVPSLIEIRPEKDRPFARFTMKFARAHSGSVLIEAEGFVFPSDRGLYLLGTERNPLPQGHVALFLDDIGRGDNELIGGLLVRRYSGGSHFASRICLRRTPYDRLESYDKSKDRIDLFNSEFDIGGEILDLIDNYVIYDGSDVLMINDFRRRIFRKEWKTVKKG